MVAWSRIRVVQWVGANISGEPVTSLFKVEETSSTLSTEAAGCFISLVHIYQTTQCKKIQIIWVLLLSVMGWVVTDILNNGFVFKTCLLFFLCCFWPENLSANLKVMFIVRVGDYDSCVLSPILMVWFIVLYTMFLLSCPWARQLYRIEMLRLTGRNKRDNIPQDSASWKQSWRRHVDSVTCAGSDFYSLMPEEMEGLLKEDSGVPRRGGFQPPPKFPSFDKVEPDCKLSEKCLVYLFQHRNYFEYCWI